MTGADSCLVPPGENIKALPVSEAQDVFDRSRALFECRIMWDDVSCWWPRAPLDARALPDDILQTEADQNTIVATIRNCGVVSVFVCDLNDANRGVYCGPLDIETLHWAKLALQSEFIAIFSFNPSLVLIGFQWLSLSAIGGHKALIEDVVRALGGEMLMSKKLREWAQSYGEPTVRAAHHMAKWSNWDNL